MIEPLVDLLLVRLGGDEEKKKVTRLLVTELDLTVGEAEKAVENSPVVIREAVSIGEARVIQKNLYPYIDLLPRLEEESAETLRDKVRFVSPPDELPEDSDDRYDNAGADSGPSSGQDRGDRDLDEDMEEEEEESDEFLLTTARDEMLQIDRCHICGKTPVGGEKLAPCRTCGELTCRECFDRAAHVCHKCAAEGHAVDRPVASKPHGRSRTPVRREPVQTHEPPAPARDYSWLRKALLAVIVVATLALFYFLDPLDLFSGTTPAPREIASTPDTTAAPPELPDTVTAAVAPDTAATVPPATVSDPVGVADLALPDSMFAGSPFPAIEACTRVPQGVGASSATVELETILPQLEALADHSGILVDRAALLVYGDREKTDHLSVLVLAVNHPENNEARFALLASAGGWLVSGGIDQLVLIYRETRFHQPQFFSYTSITYPDLAEAFSPGQFQDLASTHDAVWASLTGPVTEWICGM
jgi:hypothetical protein